MVGMGLVIWLVQYLFVFFFHFSFNFFCFLIFAMIFIGGRVFSNLFMRLGGWEVP